MDIKYNKSLFNMLAILAPILYLIILNSNCFIVLSIILFFISYVGFKMRKSKDIKLSLILLTILFALGNLGLGLYDSNLISLKICI
jgi:NADH:ubiquinone oxidoreductase subunit K